MEGNIRVLHIINGEFYAGAERVQDYLALRLPDFNVQVEFACLKLRDFAKYTLTTEVPVLDFAMASKLDFSVIKDIVQYTNANDFNLIHTHTPRSSLVGSVVSRMTGLPMVHHIHSPTTFDTDNFWRNRLNAFSEWLSLKKACHLIAVSRAMERHMAERGISQDKISVVHNGVPVQTTKKQRSIPGEKWILGTIAFYRPRKGLEVLLEAMHQLLELGHDVHLRIVGAFETDEYKNKILDLAHQMSLQAHITWVGFSNNIVNELQQMDLFVLPSLYGEGLPMVVLESMSEGVPVVASDVEGIPEAVRDGKDGSLFAPGDTPGLIHAIQRILTGADNWKSMSMSAQERQQNLFSDLSMAQGVNSVYRKILSGHNIPKG